MSIPIVKELGKMSKFHRCGHQLNAEVGDKWQLTNQ